MVVVLMLLLGDHFLILVVVIALLLLLFMHVVRSQASLQEQLAVRELLATAHT